MQKILVTIDVSKIDKNKLIDRTFTNSEGKEVKTKEYQMEVIELKTPQFVKDGDSWIMMKTHFVAEGQSKQERADKAATKFLGKGIQFEKKTAPLADFKPTVAPVVEQTAEQKAALMDIDPADIPF